MAKYRNETKWDTWIDQAAAKNGVPAWVIKSTIAAESAFDPTAYNPEAGSRWGPSRGLMQFIEATARRMGLAGAIGDDATRTGGLYEPQIAIALGGKLLGSLRRRYPMEPWDAIYAAYNAGSIFRTPGGGFTNQAQVDNWTRRADYFKPDWRAGRADPSQGSSGRPLDPPPLTPVGAGDSGLSSPAPCTCSTGTADGSTTTEDHDMTDAFKYAAVLVTADTVAVLEEINRYAGEGFRFAGHVGGLVLMEWREPFPGAADARQPTAETNEGRQGAVDSGKSAIPVVENATGESARAASDHQGECPAAGPGDCGDTGETGDTGAA